MDTIISPDSSAEGASVQMPGSKVSAAEERIAVATQWQLMWMRSRKHRLAMVSLVVIILFYLVAIFANFLAYLIRLKQKLTAR